MYLVIDASGHLIAKFVSLIRAKEYVARHNTEVLRIRDENRILEPLQ